MKPFISVFLLIFLNLWNLPAQSPAGDSIFKELILGEVCICSDNDSLNESFNFWKRNKLATTEDMLSRLSGVSLIRRGPFGQEPGLRAYSGAQTNLTIDGMRIYGACADRMDPASIYLEPVNLSGIQVSHGSSGSIYGSTVGGQINMSMKNPDYSCHEAVSGQAALSFSSVNSGIHSNLWIQQNAGKFAYRLSSVYRKAGDYIAGNGNRVAHSAYEKGNVSGVFEYKPDSLQTIRLTCLGDFSRNIGYPALPMDLGQASAQIYSLSYVYENETGFLRKNESKIYFNTISHEMDDTRRKNVAMHMDMPGHSRTIGFYSEMLFAGKMYLRADAHRLNALSEMSMFPLNQPVMYLQSLPENSFFDAGVALHKEFDFAGRQKLKVSARVDYCRQAGAVGSGQAQWSVFNEDIAVAKTNMLKNAGINYNILFNKKFQSRLTVAYGERIPSTNERYGYYLFNPQDQYDYLGRPGINPERSLQTELLIKKEWKKVSVSFNGFLHHISDYIYAVELKELSPVTNGAGGVKTYQNISFATMKGFEISGEADFWGDFHYVASTKFAFGNTFDGKPLPLVPPFKLQHALKYSVGKYAILAEHDYSMAQHRVNPDYKDRKTSAFHILNLRISCNFNFTGRLMQVSASCENLFNGNYREHLDIGNIPRQGRNILLGVSYRF